MGRGGSGERAGDVLAGQGYQRIPTRTVLTAWAACPKGTPAMLMRDRLDVMFRDEEFADLFPKDGRRTGHSDTHGGPS